MPSTCRSVTIGAGRDTGVGKALSIFPPIRTRIIIGFGLLLLSPLEQLIECDLDLLEALAELVQIGGLG